MKYMTQEIQDSLISTDMEKAKRINYLLDAQMANSFCMVIHACRQELIDQLVNRLDGFWQNTKVYTLEEWIAHADSPEWEKGERAIITYVQDDMFVPADDGNRSAIIAFNETRINLNGLPSKVTFLAWSYILNSGEGYVEIRDMTGDRWQVSVTGTNPSCMALNESSSSLYDLKQRPQV